MEFYETDEGRLGIREIPLVLADLLRQAPHCGNRESEEVEARLFPVPSIDASEEGLREDWKVHVEPELHEWFLSARQVVEADLRGMKEENEFCELEIPRNHAEAWLNALNQARLALAAEYGFGEKELSQQGPLHVMNEKDLAVLQINFFAMIQQWLVEVTDS